MLQICNILELLETEGDFPYQMANSGGTGHPLVKQGSFAADLIRFQPTKCIHTHVHPGDHILVCLEGTGTLEFNGEKYPLERGTIYMVQGNVPHAILTDESDERLTLLSIANRHFPVDSTERSELV